MNFKELKEKPPNVDDETKLIIQNFLKFSSRHIGLKDLPKIKLYSDPKLASARRSFGGYMGGRIELNVGNRHIMDVLRTLAHELVHFKQDTMGVLGPDSGEDGSKHENEANAKAAVIMRLWGKMNPDLFQHAALLAESTTKKMIHDLADRKGIPWDNEPSFLKLTKQLTGKEHLDDLDADQLQKVYDYIKKDEVDESLKGLAAAGLLGLGMLGGAKPVNPGIVPPEVRIQQQQAQAQAQLKKNNIKTTAVNPKAPGGAAKVASVAKPKTLSPKASLLMKTAQEQGIKGVELAQFLAQMEHESWDFKKMKEVPAGKGYFNRYDPKYNPQLAKQLGNKYAGDGTAFRGRGFIQLTGRRNYTQASYDIFRDDRLIKNPDLAAKPEIAARIAVWYWNERVKPYVRDFNDTAAVTKKINGGLSGLQDRHNNFKDYMASLGA